MPVLAAANELQYTQQPRFLCAGKGSKVKVVSDAKREMKANNKQANCLFVFVIRPWSAFKNDFIFLSEIVSELAYLFIYLFLLKISSLDQ